MAAADEHRTGAGALARAAADPLDVADGRVLAALGRAWQAQDPVPDDLAERVKFAVALDEVMAEVASIQRLSPMADAGVRGTDTATSISFSTAGMGVMVRITSLAHDRRRIDGWITPAGAHVVRLRHRDRSWHTRADDGRFAYDDVPDGMVQLTVGAGPTTSPTLVTPVFEL